MKKFIVEFGMGTDFHGQDVTKAARKAVRDAVSRSCLCGLEDVLGLTDFTRQVHIVATVAVPRPEEVDCSAVAEELPVAENPEAFCRLTDFYGSDLQYGELWRCARCAGTGVER